MSLGIVELLNLRGLPSGPTKLVRHQDARFATGDLFHAGSLELYQSFQSKPIFDGVTFIVSFLGLSGSRARFIGVFRVGRRLSGAEGRRLTRCSEAWADARFFYELERVNGFSDFEYRVIVDWGKGAVAWHQRLREKVVLEISPAGHLMAPFRDYLDFSLTFLQLRHLYQHQSANSEWIKSLSAVGGIYLILDTTTGNQYVGSAYGAGGVWSRWAEYARNGHGGNVRLKALVARADFPDAFTYSLLQIVPRTMPRANVFALEKRFKAKLGSRATGLNGN